MDKAYNAFSKKVYNDIQHYRGLMIVYKSYKNMVWGGEQHPIIPTLRYEQWVISYIGNALIVDLYMTLRRLLSTGSNEFSLYNFHHKYITYKISEKDEEKYKKLYLKHLLPKSYDEWLELKTYINKKVAHSDIENIASIVFPIEKTEKIFKDLKNSYWQVILTQESALLPFTQEQLARFSKIVFNRMMPKKD